MYKFESMLAIYVIATVNISKIFTNGNALSVFLPERVAKNINLKINSMILLSLYFM